MAGSALVSQQPDSADQLYCWTAPPFHLPQSPRWRRCWAARRYGARRSRAWRTRHPTSCWCLWATGRRRRCGLQRPPPPAASSAPWCLRAACRRWAAAAPSCHSRRQTCASLGATRWRCCWACRLKCCTCRPSRWWMCGAATSARCTAPSRARRTSQVHGGRLGWQGCWWVTSAPPAAAVRQALVPPAVTPSLQLLALPRFLCS